MTIWSDHPELVEQLRVMWTEGLSAAQCSRALGYGISRNACIGKALRLGLVEHGKQRLYHPRGPSRAPGVPAPSKPLPPPDARGLVPLLLEDGSPITAENSTRHHCRYIYGEIGQNYQYCGRQVEKGSFCPSHRAVCYTPPLPHHHNEEAA